MWNEQHDISGFLGAFDPPANDCIAFSARGCPAGMGGKPLRAACLCGAPEWMGDTEGA